MRVALLLLVVSRTVKDEGALAKLGGPGLFVDLLEDDDARIRHAAATFLEVGPTLNPQFSPAPKLQDHIAGAIQEASFFLPAALQWRLGRLGQLPCLIQSWQVIVRAQNINCCM